MPRCAQSSASGQADRAGADDHQRVALRSVPLALLGALPVGELGIGVGLGHRALALRRLANSFSCIQAACLGARLVRDHSSSMSHFTSSSFSYISGVPVSAGQFEPVAVGVEEVDRLEDGVVGDADHLDAGGFEPRLGVFQLLARCRP